MKLIVDSKKVHHVKEFADLSTGLRRNGMVYLQQSLDADRVNIRVISEETNGEWLRSEILKGHIFIPIDQINVQS